MYTFVPFVPFVRKYKIAKCIYQKISVINTGTPHVSFSDSVIRGIPTRKAKSSGYSSTYAWSSPP